ncbi:MAG TPA: hypothetical protein VM536_02560 [Chloroflexia bacterium]|nr:hypothetical protein [Chloroflexia bacterium]
MNETTPSGHKKRDAAAWSEPVSTLKVAAVPAGAVNLNVEGRRVVGPVQGFGPLWQKTFRLRLAGANVTPGEVVQLWKQEFPKLQPRSNRFYPSEAGVEPGQVVLINAVLLGIPVDTGMLVLFADDTAFTLMTPEGHPESAWITFSAHDDDGCTVAQIQTMARANDPVFEIGFRLFGSRAQERIWVYVLRELGARFGVRGVPVTIRKTCMDPRMQWREMRNVWMNATIRSMIYVILTPVRQRRIGRRPARRG